MNVALRDGAITQDGLIHLIEIIVAEDSKLKAAGNAQSVLGNRKEFALQHCKDIDVNVNHIGDMDRIRFLDECMASLNNLGLINKIHLMPKEEVVIPRLLNQCMDDVKGKLRHLYDDRDNLKVHFEKFKSSAHNELQHSQDVQLITSTPIFRKRNMTSISSVSRSGSFFDSRRGAGFFSRTSTPSGSSIEKEAASRRSSMSDTPEIEGLLPDTKPKKFNEEYRGVLIKLEKIIQLKDPVELLQYLDDFARQHADILTKEHKVGSTSGYIHEYYRNVREYAETLQAPVESSERTELKKSGWNRHDGSQPRQASAVQPASYRKKQADPKKDPIQAFQHEVELASELTNPQEKDKRLNDLSIELSAKDFDINVKTGFYAMIGAAKSTNALLVERSIRQRPPVREVRQLPKPGGNDNNK